MGWSITRRSTLRQSSGRCAAIAAVTTKLDLGVLVSGVIPHPALMAKMAATMDDVSHGA